MDGLNTQLSRKSEWGEVQHLAFDEDKVRSWSVFRTEFNEYMTSHCGENIKGLIESEKLSGAILTNDLGIIFHGEVDSTARLN